MFQSFAAFRASLLWGRKAADCHMLLRMMGRLKCLATGLEAFFVVTSWGVLGIGRLVVSPFHRCITFCKEASYALDDIGWSTFEMISDRDGSLGSRYFLNAANERTCFVSCACALKVPGWSLLWKALLTKKLSMFISMFSSRLNEINGAFKKMLPVSDHFEVI